MYKKNNVNSLNEIEAEQREECFIITPIGTYGSDVYNKAMGLIDAVIDPVLKELDMCAMPANRMPDLGSINKQLIKRIVEDKLVIANLTGLNPNVMYELAIRHGARRPVIIMAEEGTRLPFDITDQRAIFYSDTLSGVEKAKEELRKKIKFALEDKEPDNPIYTYLENAKLFKDVKADDPLNAILKKLDDLSPKFNMRNKTMFDTRDFRWSELPSDSYKYTITGIFEYAKTLENNEELISALVDHISKEIELFSPNVYLDSISLNSDQSFIATLKFSTPMVAHNFLNILGTNNNFKKLSMKPN